MKRLFLATLALSLAATSCRKEDNAATVKVDVATQNSFDDEATAKFLTENYLDDQGNVVTYSATSTADDNIPSLATLPKEVLNSGVIVLRRASAQPTPGKAIGSSDILRVMYRSIAFVAKKDADGAVKFLNGVDIRNTLSGYGTPDVDPFFYYAKKSLRGSRDRSFYEIEGFREAIQTFKSCEIPDDANYNLQGVIIVPSRAAYARDANVFDKATSKFDDRTFVFNFQIYKTSERPAAEL